jgi:hypothetical protein
MPKGSPPLLAQTVATRHALSLLFSCLRPRFLRNRNKKCGGHPSINEAIGILEAIGISSEAVGYRILEAIGIR